MNGELPAEEVSADVLSAVEQNIPAATRHFVEFAATVARAPEQVLTETSHLFKRLCTTINAI